MSVLHGPIYAHLKADAAVFALVGDRIYRDRATEGDPLPYIVFERRSENRHPHSTGASGLVEATYEVTSWAADRNAANALAEAVRLALDTTTGTMGDGAVTETTIRSTDLTSTNDVEELPKAGNKQGSDESVPGVEQTFDIWYEETPP